MADPALSPAATPPAPRPYRTALTGWLGSALAAGLMTGVIDALLTLSGQETGPGDGAAVVRVTVGLFLGLALVIGLAQTLIAGAYRATHPEGLGAALRRLRADEPRDLALTAWLLAGCVVGLVLVGIVALGALSLVATVERKGAGAVILGVVTLASLPFLGLAAYPVYRVTRKIAPVIPSIGALPRAAIFVLMALVIVVAGGVGVVMTQLDWQALPLGVPAMLLVFFVLQWVFRLLGGKALKKAPKVALTLVLAALAAVGPVLALKTTVSPRAVALLTTQSKGARALVGVARKLADRDHDGYAAALGGGDCKEGDATVNPGAEDIPGDGIDQNCNGADAKAKPKKPTTAVEPGKPAEPAAKAAWGKNILFIAVDTLRADRLGMQRDGKSLTPNLDALMKKGVYFTHAWAQAPHTPRSFPSIFFSRYPSAIPWDKSFANYPNVQPEAESVFEALSAGGYATTGHASHFYFTEERGIRQGFSRFDNEGAQSLKDSNTDSAAPRIVPRAVAELKDLAGKKERFTMFVHLFEPHSTYVEHEGLSYKEKGHPAAFIEKYDREVEFVDHWLGELLAGLEASGLAADTAIVLISDHGEGFFTHSYAGKKLGWHGQSLYDDVLRVPILFVVPGLARPATVDTPVMLLDVAPTLLDLAGVAIPEAFQGRSLLPALQGQPLEPREVHAELLPYPNNDVGMKMVVTGDGKEKLIHNDTDNVDEVFDLVADPGEQTNLAFVKDPAAEARARRLRELLAGWVDSEL